MVQAPSILLVHSHDEKLATLGGAFEKLSSDNSFKLQVFTCSDPDKLASMIAMHTPNLIVTIRNNSESKFYNILNSFDSSINERWVEVGSFTEAFDTERILYLINLAVDKFVGNHSIEFKSYPTGPRFSICVPMYKATIEMVDKLYASVKKQSFQDWELVIFGTELTHWSVKRILDIMEQDPRVRYVKNTDPLSIGNIGRTKHNCFVNAVGEYLIELDHDDELVPRALEILNEAIESYRKVVAPDGPEFLYTDCWERNVENNTPIDYGRNYAFGLGSRCDWDESVEDSEFEKIVFKSSDMNPYNLQSFNITPDISSAALRHIISVPNHMRVWKRTFYHKIGGHSRTLSICDDYELILRSFVNATTKFMHVVLPLYIQNMHGDNSQESSRNFIQYLVPRIFKIYESKINEICGNKTKIDDDIVRWYHNHGNQFETEDLEEKSVKFFCTDMQSYVESRIKAIKSGEELE